MNDKLKFKKGKKMNIEIDTTKSTDEMIAQVLPTLLDAIKEKAYVNGYKASDTEALGLVVSKFTKWDLGAILNVTSEALEDANFDDVATQIDRLA
jgi:hypothetical protein|tara:strand:- start:1119 stop:1403 length:285 start_codon:yes stop_codon:yes gene_type:complete